MGSLSRSKQTQLQWQSLQGHFCSSPSAHSCKATMASLLPTRQAQTQLSGAVLICCLPAPKSHKDLGMMVYTCNPNTLLAWLCKVKVKRDGGLGDTVRVGTWLTHLKDTHLMVNPCLLAPSHLLHISSLPNRDNHIIFQIQLLYMQARFSFRNSETACFSYPTNQHPIATSLS